jgi:hypothetical protein
MAVAPGRATALAALWCLLAPHVLDAQVLTTGETLGKGKSGILLSDNIVVPGDDIPNLNTAYGEFARGLTDRFDLYLAAGATTTDGAAQGWLGGGGNLRLIRIRKVTLSFFSIASVALTRRDEACQVLWNPALVASVPLSKTFSVYTGLNGLVPIGDRERGIFTPPSATTNVPIGGTYAIGPWGLWGEADVGNLKAVGFGLTRVF